MPSTSTAWQRPALRTDEEFDKHRPVSWLELFFDLVFVVVIARLAHTLSAHIDGPGIASFAIQFLGIFWAWNAYTYYTERFESDGLENRLFTFLAMVPVAGLAVFSDDGLGSKYVGFALCYVLARGVNEISWFRACLHVPSFRPTGYRFFAGYALAVAVILVSFTTDGPLRWAMFTSAVLVEILTPYSTIPHQSRLPRLSTSKFPERFGLLTMIVLGESVTGVISGLSELQDHDELHGTGYVSGVLGLAVGFGLWWVYFDFIARRSPKPIFSTALLWVYLHLVTITAITMTGVGISGVIAQGAVGQLPAVNRYLLVSAVALALLGMAALQLTLSLSGTEQVAHPTLGPILKSGAAVVIGALGLLDLNWSVPALLGLLLLGLSVPMAYGTLVWFGGPPPGDKLEEQAVEGV